MTKSKLFNSEFTAYILVTFLAVCSYVILIKTHWPNLEALTSAAYGVTEGRPHWLAYQNRLLGPYTVLLISIIGVSFKTAWAIYHAITLQILCILVFWILRREALSIKAALGYLTCFLFAFLAFQDYWFYTWDSIDLIIFTAFAYGILKSFSLTFFTSLFLVGILNRESALFIAVYLILNSLRFDQNRFMPVFDNAISLIVGSVLLVSGMVYTKLIRDALFVSKPDGFPDTKHELIGNHVYFFGNVKNLFISNFFDRHFFVSVFVLVTVTYFIMQWKKMNDRQLKCFLVALVLLINILVFGILNETRMHFILFPFFLFLWLSINSEFGAGGKRTLS